MNNKEKFLEIIKHQYYRRLAAFICLILAFILPIPFLIVCWKDWPHECNIFILAAMFVDLIIITVKYRGEEEGDDNRLPWTIRDKQLAEFNNPKPTKPETQSE